MGWRAPEEAELEDVFRESILQRRHVLAAFITSATVQTNEAARGLCWLLPVFCTGWSSLHLVELGAAAGLNLAADAQRYSLYASPKHNQQGQQTQKMLHQVGRGRHGHFAVHCLGDTPQFNAGNPLPLLLSRTGCDLAPCFLRNQADEQTLAAFVWGDQAERLQGLRHGIAALRELEAKAVPIRLVQANLPDDLEIFLSTHLPADEAPIVVFNTYLSTYLRDKGASFRSRLAKYAGQRRQPLLWLQWEIDWQAKEQGLISPEFGQLAWTADLWQQGEHHHWHLAWVHPHGTRLHWRAEARAWLEFWRR